MRGNWTGSANGNRLPAAPDAPQGIKRARFSPEANAGGEQGIVQGSVLRKRCTTTTENGRFALIFPHNVVEIAHTTLTAVLILCAGGDHDLELGDFGADNVRFVGKSLGAVVTSTIYGKRARVYCENMEGGCQNRGTFGVVYVSVGL